MRVVSCPLVVCLLATIACAADPLPDLSGDGLAVTFTSRKPDDLRGTLQLNGKSYPFTAANRGDAHVTGTFTVDGQAYGFTMTVEGKAVTLESGGTKYRLTAAGVAPAAPAGGRPGITYVPGQLVDPTTRLVVGSLLVPDGWKVEPGILWRPMDAQFVTLRTAVFDPDSGWAVRWIPHDQFSCDPALYDNAVRQGAKPRSAAGIEYTRQLPKALEYIQSIVLPRYRNIEGLKITRQQDLPELAKAVDQSQPFTRQVYAAGGRELAYTAARVRVEYPGPGGVPLEEEIICVLNTSWSPQAIAMAKQVGLTGEHFFMPDSLYSFTAPKGQLDTAIPYLQTIRLSLRPDANWIKFVDNVQGAVTAVLNDRYKMEEAARRAITESQRKSVEASWKSADQQSRDVGALLSGTQARTNPNNPSGPPVAGPAGKRSWTNPRGEWKHLEPQDDPNTHPGSTKDWVEAKNTQN